MEEQVFSGIPAVDLIVRRPTNVDPLHSLSFMLPAFSSMLQRDREICFQEIYDAYRTDGYFHRAVLRYVQLGFSSGFKINASPRVARYLEQRLQIVANLDDNTVINFCKQSFRDFILYGTVMYLKGPTSKLTRLCGFRLPPTVFAGMFPVSPRFMFPVFDKAGNQIKWFYRGKNAAGADITKEFEMDEVVVLKYDKGTNSIYGTPAFIAVVSDIMAERQVEDSILKLVYKYPNPIVHIETPAVGSSRDEGAAEDMQRIAAMIRNMSSDTALITAPGQKVNLLGAESIALRMEEYMTLFTKRVFSGLGMNAQMMGQEVSNQKDIELDRITRDQAEDFIDQFKEQFQCNVLQMFMDEAGITEKITLELTDPDPLYKIKLETHIANLYSFNLLDEDESREAMGKKPFTPSQYKKTTLYRTKLPILTEPLEMQHDQELLAMSKQAIIDRGLARIKTKSPTKYVKKNTSPRKTKSSGASKPSQNQHS